MCGNCVFLGFTMLIEMTFTWVIVLHVEIVVNILIVLHRGIAMGEEIAVL